MNKLKDPIDIIQSSREDVANLNEFTKDLFIDLIKKISNEEFNSFCKYILHLQEFYDWNSNCWVTDKESAILGREKFFAKPGPVDFEAAINFRIVSKDADTNYLNNN